MEERRKRFPIPITCLHILHACLSIGLIVGVVHNQLVNNTRFEKLEQKCNCNHDSDEEAKRTGQNKSNTLLNSRIVGLLSSSDEHNRITKRQVSILLETNNTEHRESLKDYNAATNKTSVKNNSKETLTEKLQPTPNTTLKEKLQNTTGQIFLSNIFQEKPDLISCLEELKVIIDHYVASRENDGRQEESGCGPLEGVKGDTGAKGERGEKGCAGTSFAPPLFQPSPKEFVFNEGESHVLHCNATGNPAVQITWYRDNKIITGQRDNASRRYSIQNRDVTPFGHVRAQSICPSEHPHPVKQSNLMIRELNGLDTGTYTCNAHNFMGTSSYEIHILVQEYVYYTTIPSNITVVQGENVVLRCQASGVPAPAITWYRRDGGPMPWHYNVSNGYLHIQNITKEEEGTFTCLATNVLGSKTTEATVTVNVFPKFVSLLEKPLTINESENLILPCNASGFPTPSVHWTKINSSLPSGRYFYNSEVLVIPDVQYKDRGEYECTANNSAGSIANKVQVNVQVAPRITKRPNTTEYGYRGKTKVLAFGAFANPDANIVWRNPIHRVFSRPRIRDENGSLVIENIQYTDSGLYCAVAKNILGEVRVEVFLVVRDAVPATIRSEYPHDQPVVSLVEGQNLTKSCLAVGIPTPQITWKHKDNTTIASTISSSLDLKITNVTSSDSGQYTCLVSNQFGFEQQHFELKVISRWVTVKMYNQWGNSLDRYYSRHRYRSTSRSSGQLMTYGSTRYASNVNVQWKLTSNTRIAIKFVRFSTEACCDKVKIYDGGSKSSPSLGEFSGDSLPATITSSSNNLYITFTTDSAKEEAGFLALYSAVV